MTPMSAVSDSSNNGLIGSQGAPMFPQTTIQTSSESTLQFRLPAYWPGAWRQTDIMGRPTTAHSGRGAATAGPIPASSFSSADRNLTNRNALTQPSEGDQFATLYDRNTPLHRYSRLQDPRRRMMSNTERLNSKFDSRIPRVTTPEAEEFRMSYPDLRDYPTWKVKLYMLGSKIMRRQRNGRPYTGLPEVTPEEIQEFPIQFRSIPGFRPHETQISDAHATAFLQALKLLGLSLTEVRRLAQAHGSSHSAHLLEATQPAADDYVPEYLIDKFMDVFEISGEEEAFRFLRESKAKAAGTIQKSGPSHRKRSKTATEESNESPNMRMPGRHASSGRVVREQAFALDAVFNPLEDDPYGGALAFGPMRSMDVLIDDNPAVLGITRIQNSRGETMVAGSSGRSVRNNDNSSPVLNRTIDIYIEDDLVGAAESTAPVEKFRRLMSSSPTPQSPKKRARRELTDAVTEEDSGDGHDV
ncbi:hypothetical protein J7T55_010813 [Diaporthe amygdali]|uniref:uncharacterized protein n=1 Tax=Phomopsis amygdali TaxID=1214568 RepID=UPI0022FE6E4B|nr:uncharacterized protein J7T55_010813 [Diaporthe amygdali]KAJ0114424.1 hypothetical protein J7T55_010813 [Diaporthe amygdali]